MKRFEELQNLVNGLEGDFEKFYDKGNNAAGTRVRKGMQEMKNLAQDIRKEVQDKKNKSYLKRFLTAFFMPYFLRDMLL